jgi:hypothetical protein
MSNRFQYPIKSLSAEATEVKALAQTDSEQEITKAEAQQSTVARDEAADALRTRLAQPVMVDGRKVIGSALAGFVVGLWVRL